LPKPFDLDELEARLHALVRRRVSPQQHSDADLSALGEWRCDPHSGALYCHGKVVDMPARELALMGQLMLKPGRAVTKEALFAQVFADDPEVQLEAIEVVVYRLRKRLKDTGVSLVTLRGLGYLLKLGE
jgi:two-component system, OmpR family, response regulator TctD